MQNPVVVASTKELQPSEVFVPPELSHGEIYHVFFSYSSTDYQWTHSLIQLLEDRGLRVCYHERDFTPGRPILENMSESIQQSQKVLLVLSPDFVRSRWCLLEANMSMFRDCLERKPIVPVLLQQDVSIPLHLCHLTYLEAQHPDFTQQLLRVLCMPNRELQGSTVVPYQPPSIYNGKSLQPLTAVNEEELNKFDCGVWSDMEVPEQLRLIIQHPERYREAIRIINTVSETKVKYRSLWSQALFGIGAVLIILFCIAGLGILLNIQVTDNAQHALKTAGVIFVIAGIIWVFYKVVVFRKKEFKRIVCELQKAIGQANTLLFEENILVGSQSNSKLYLVYVSLDGCRQEISALFQEQDEVEDVFNEAILQYSCGYTCCLAKRYFPFQTTSNAGHVEGGVCFCQYVLHQLTLEKTRIFNCCRKHPS